MGERAVRQRGAFQLRATLRWLLAVTGVAAGVAPASAAPCIAYSGERTLPLVELYVAQRCTGCQAAEHWISSLAAQRPVQEVLPLVAHVDYADYVGQSDRDAGRRVLQRERKLLLRQRMALVYTPQVLLQGRPFRGWDGEGSPATLKQTGSQPARARLRLELKPADANELAVRVEAALLGPVQRPDAVLFMAAVERRQPSAPVRVLEWHGPFATGPDGRFAEERRLALLPGATPASSGVAAFVQDRSTSEVLQALLLSACSP